MSLRLFFAHYPERYETCPNWSVWACDGNTGGDRLVLDLRVHCIRIKYRIFWDSTPLLEFCCCLKMNSGQEQWYI